MPPARARRATAAILLLAIALSPPLAEAQLALDAVVLNQPPRIASATQEAPRQLRVEVEDLNGATDIVGLTVTMHDAVGRACDDAPEITRAAQGVAVVVYTVNVPACATRVRLEAQDAEGALASQDVTLEAPAKQAPQANPVRAMRALFSLWWDFSGLLARLAVS